MQPKISRGSSAPSFCLKILVLLQLLQCSYHYLYCSLLPLELNAYLLSAGCSNTLWEIYGKSKAAYAKLYFVKIPIVCLMTLDSGPQRYC